MHNKLIFKAQKGLNTSQVQNVAGGITQGGGMNPSSPMATVGAAADMLGSFMPQKPEYAGDYGGITQGMDAAYDGISDAAMNLPPVGTMLGGIMKAGKFINQGLNALGVGTDGMTKADAILGSSFLALTPFGLINSLGAKKSDSFSKNTEVFAEMGSGYGGSNDQADLGANKSGKKFGTFSRKGLRTANAQIAEANRQQTLISGIQDDMHTQNALSASMSDTLGNAYQNKLNGGYQQNYVQAARRGGILFNSNALNRAHQLVFAKKGTTLKEASEELNTYNWPKYIAKDSNFIKFLSTLPEEWKNYSEDHGDLYEIWRENGKPETFSESTDKRTTPMFILDDEGKTIINPEISEYESEQQTKDNQNMTYEDFVMEVAKLAEDQNNPEAFQKGGQLNIIPEGALHAHKHHLEEKNKELKGEITHKGIPVISISEDGKIEQQAEIERNEIIFNLEVTKQIESLREEYHKAESQKEKDRIAEEAGRILSDSIIEDTDDRTNLMKQIK